MPPNEHLRKVMKILIFAFLCTEMQTTFTQRELKHVIVGGSEFPPYQASIRLMAQERDFFGKGHICSGVLVAPSVVISVKECLFNYEDNTFYHPAELRVMLGSSQRFAPTNQGLILGVTHVYEPPKDLAIAVLMLERDVPPEHAYIQPIPLPQTCQESVTRGQINGWFHKGQRAVHELIMLPNVELEMDCPRKRTQVYIDSSSQLRMDKGAPLVANGQLVGLKISDKAFSVEFLELSSQVDWIEQQIGDGTHQNSGIWGMLGFLVFTAYVLKVSRKSFMN